MSRRIALVVAFTLLAAGCGEDQLGRRIPSCDPNQAGGAILLEVAAIPGVEYVPCVHDLKVGWDFEHVVARTGRARFWVGSDRVGSRFVEVTLAPSCDVGDARRVVSDEGRVPLFVDLVASETSVTLVVVPEGFDPAVRAYADDLAETLRGAALRDWSVGVRIDLSDDPIATRIDAALASGDPALLVGARETEEGVVELYLGQGTSPLRLEPADVMDAVDDTLGDPRYEAVWYYPFRDGCVIYDIDAEGPGADRISFELQEALGLYPVDPLRRYAEEVGWVIP